MSNRARRHKAILMIGQDRSVAAKTFSAAFHDDAARSKAGVASDIEAHWGTRLLPGEMKTLPHQILMEASPPPYDAVIEFATERADGVQKIADLVAASAHQLKACMDPRRSAVLVGEEIKITLGDGPIFLVMPLRRLPNLSHREFMAHWFERHADLGEAVEGVRYRQNHVNEAATKALAERLGLSFDAMDGVTESYFTGIDEAEELLSREEVAVGAIEDEKRFIDHSRSQFGFYRRIS